MIADVDVVVLTRTCAPLRAEVQDGLAQQFGVRIQVHQVVGDARADDANRWETIARARNQGKTVGSAPYLFFLDDDVVLPSGAIARLLRELRNRPLLGGLAADYLGESRRGVRAKHVSMGATLFRRSALDRVAFRWESARCECQCCCDDLRRKGIEIAYSRSIRAIHLSPQDQHQLHSGSREVRCDLPTSELLATNMEQSESPLILCAFDHRHYRHFRDQFLTSLRSSGNNERVLAVGYELYPSQQRECRRQPNVELHMRRNVPPISPAQGRLADFQTLLENIPPQTPVAYWDAGDVLFQSSLLGLWDEVQRFPTQLHVAREPLSYQNNPGATSWVETITDSQAREAALRTLMAHDCLNSGFAAATAATMLRYLSAAHTLLHSAALAGTSDWGDQTAMNLYCRWNPELYREVDSAWNYCLCGHDLSQFRFDHHGRLTSTFSNIRVAHGNARTLQQVAGYAMVRQHLRSLRAVGHGAVAIPS